MKIIPCNIQNIRFQKSCPAFTSNPAATDEIEQTDSISSHTPDYNVRVPIKYSHVEDIKLNDAITAKCYKLANGQKVIIVPKEGSTFVKTYVNTGSFNEPDKLRGISHYIEHNLFNGSEDLGEEVFFDEVNKMGAYTNASTSFANTNYYIHSNMLDDTDLENKIRLHAGMLTSPKFLTDKLEKEKQIVNSEINMCLSEDENIGFTKTVKNLFNVNSTSSDLVAGSTDNISALTREDVVEYFNNNYYPANMTTIITGEVDPDKTIELIAKYFNNTKTPTAQRNFEKMTPTEKAVREDVISEKSESGTASIFLGFVGPENNNGKDRIYVHALGTLACELYDSRLADTERKYGVSIMFSPERLSSRPNDKAMLLIETKIPDENSEGLIKELYQIINDLSQKPPSEEELQAVKNALKKSYDLTLETSGGLNNIIGTYFINEKIDTLKDYNNIIDNMTAEDIQNMAKKYLDLNKVALTVVHPKGTTTDDIEKSYKQISEKDIKNVSFTGAVKKTPIHTDNIKTYRTHNNYEVVLNNTPSNTVQLSMAINKPEWNVKKAATAEVLSDILKNAGTEFNTVQDLSKVSDQYAIDSSIYAGNSGIYLCADFPTDSTDKALDIFKEKILHPNFSENEFNNAIKRLKDNYKSVEVNPYDKLNAKIFENTPMAYTTKEMLESLDAVTLNDVKELYNEIMKNTSQGKFVLTGPFNKKPELRDKIFNSINEYPQMTKWENRLKDIYSPVEKTEVYTDINLKNQADILQCYRYQNNGNLKDNLCVNLLDIILGGSSSSRLFSDLREKRHLAYHVSSTHSDYENMGTFTLKIGTTTENKETGEKTFDNVQKAINGFNENINLIKTQKVSEEELESAKKQLKSKILDSVETNSGKNDIIESDSNTFYGLDYANKFYNSIDSITAEDILNTANKIFNSKPIYSLTGTKDTIDANKEFLESLTQV